MKRRNFIKKSAFISTGTLLVPAFVQASNFSSGLGNMNKKLVVIQFSGGNDGLNTIVPYKNDLYYQARPQIAISSNEVIKVSEDLGFNPALAPLRELYDNGEFGIINSVGYPDPDRSHFRSMDIWHTASKSDEYLTQGWLGRYLDRNEEANKAYQAIEVNDSLSLAMKGEKRSALSLTDPAKLYKVTRGMSVKSPTNHEEAHSNLGYLRKTMAETISSAAYVHEKSKTYRTKVSYPGNEFARDLKTVAQLINSGIETEVFYVTLGGFDTHANQPGRQNSLLKKYAEAMKIFIEDLKSQNKWNDTLVMTFSEFGRRVGQNGSRGTDHGTANNLYLMGGKIRKPGFFNDGPDLTNLDKGDLKYQIDFRSVYEDILTNWLEVNNNGIIDGNYQKHSFF